ncbi:MAG: cytochrome ubiquinol oxidase subunit I [Candidatus Manganitrophus sp.]|nr:MAG: cytochrome ubiquinol oxidase subunit I [Candidatus Manganitrophus sp.]
MPEILEPLGRVNFPLIGNSLVIGLFSLLHIALASLSVGFMILAPIFEGIGRGDRFYTQVAHRLTRFTLVTFTASLVLAVIMIELFVGLFPRTNSWMFNQFRYPIYLAIGAFFLQLFCLYPYYHFWEPIRRRSPALHRALGFLAAFFVLVWVAILDGMGSYMLTPASAEGDWANLMNPTWLPLVIHRFFGNFVFAGFAIAAYAGWMLGRGRGDPEGEAYYTSLLKIGFLIGLAALLIQPFTGLFYATQIRSASPEAYAQLIRGRYQWLVYLQFVLIAFLFTGSHLILRSLRAERGRTLPGEWLLFGSALLMVLFVERPTLRRLFTFLLVGFSLFYLYRWREGLRAAGGEQLNRSPVRRLAISLGVVSLLTYWTMGTIRETARRPDTVRNIISLYDEARLKTAGPGAGGQGSVNITSNAGPPAPDTRPP